MKALDALKKLEALEEKRRELHKEIMTLMNDYGHLFEAGRAALGTSVTNMKDISADMRENDGPGGTVKKKAETQKQKEEKERREIEEKKAKKRRKAPKVLGIPVSF